jgi:hypothetical protein
MMDVVYNEAMYDFPVLSTSTTPIILAKGNETAVQGRRAAVADDLDDAGFSTLILQIAQHLYVIFTFWPATDP